LGVRRENETIDAVGPEIFTYRELARRRDRRREDTAG
jgi:hypothetical protein